MAKKKKGRVPTHLRKYLFKSKKGKRSMAKKKKRSRPRRTTTTKRASPRRHHSRRRRHHGGGGGSSFALVPPREDLKMMGASAVVGFIETKAKADSNFFLNKVPKPVNQLGYTGNLALVLRVVAHYSKNKWALLGARAAANIASYHIGRMGKPFSSGTEMFAISGWSDDDVAQALQENLGALSPDGGGMPGVLAYSEDDMDY